VDVRIGGISVSVETDIPVWKSRLGAGKDASPGTMDYPDRLMEVASISQCVCVSVVTAGRGVV